MKVVIGVSSSVIFRIVMRICTYRDKENVSPDVTSIRLQHTGRIDEELLAAQQVAVLWRLTALLDPQINHNIKQSDERTF